MTDVGEAERLAAEAYAAGAVGLEERERDAGIALLLYAPEAAADAVHRRVAACAGAGSSVGAPERVPDADWSEAWKEGLEAIVISPQLVIRPSFVSHSRAVGQCELVIDPGQAFGTGGHASTRLALEWIDLLAPGLKRGARLLDVGTGSGVLALAALRRGPLEAVAFDTDALATAAARANARANGLASRLRLFTGTPAALGAGAFDLVVANLLRSELLPWLEVLAARTRPSGRAVFSGLLARERRAVESPLLRAGFRIVDVREREDASGDAWVSLLTQR